MSASPSPTWGYPVLILIGSLVAAGGLAFVRDYRGFASWHAAKTVDFFWPVQRRLNELPPWRWLPNRLVAHLHADALRHQRRAGRIVGAGFILAGVIVALAGIVGLLSRLL